MIGTFLKKHRVYSVEKIASIVKPIAEQYGTGTIWLFGSHSRGKATQGSDIDRLIVPGEIKGHLRFIRFSQELEKAFEKAIDAVPYSDNPKFMDRISKDMVTIYEP